MAQLAAWLLLLAVLCGSSFCLAGRIALDKATLPSCTIAMPEREIERDTQTETDIETAIGKGTASSSPLPRVVSIGDIHGSYDGLLENLFHANITASKTKCEWKSQPHRTVLVQMGDYVDRGPGALEALRCVRDLQAKAMDFNAEVVRIVGSKYKKSLLFVFSYCSQ